MFQDFPFSQPLLHFFYLSGFLSRTFTSHWTQEKGEGISLIPHYNFHLLYRRLGISRAITAESSPLYIASSRTQTKNLFFPKGRKSPTTMLRILYLTEHFDYETSLIKRESNNSYGRLVFFWGRSVNYLRLVVFYFYISDKLFLSKF